MRRVIDHWKGRRSVRRLRWLNRNREQHMAEVIAGAGCAVGVLLIGRYHLRKGWLPADLTARGIAYTTMTVEGPDDEIGRVVLQADRYRLMPN